MTAFTDTSESHMYVYESPDATGFRLLRAGLQPPRSGEVSVLDRPPAEGLRTPRPRD
ncbi:hypothetical protein [Streptosporangium sp. NPDC049644]|uniref:hypothetical protein n=1 Tax=Streptosporangium sp. NPDC049644 TaxID=3155507 RepID=UPI00341AF3BE